MASTLPIIDPCCTTSCTTTTGVQIPGPTGPEGPEGPAGAAGSSGLNAYTTLAANFTMPAELASAQATAVNTGWMVVGQNLFVQTLGNLQVVSVDSSTLVTLLNLEDTPSSAYLLNAAPGSIAPSGSRVGPSGLQGPPGLFSQIYQGRQATSTPPDDPNQPALDFPIGGGTLYQWDVPSQLWV